MGVISVEALGYGDWYTAALAPTQTYFGKEVRNFLHFLAPLYK